MIFKKLLGKIEPKQGLVPKEDKPKPSTAAVTKSITSSIKSRRALLDEIQ